MTDGAETVDAPDDEAADDRDRGAVDPAGAGRWHDGLSWAMVGVLGSLVLVTRLPGLVSGRTFNTDEATLGIGGRALAEGGSLYVDVIDRKPPLPFAVYGLVGTEHLALVRLVVAGLLLVAALVAASEAFRRWGAGAAWAAGVVMVLGAAALAPADAQAANFELFALLPIVVAVVAAARGRAGWAGVALAVAVLCKQPAAATVLPVGWSWWATRRWRGVVVGIVAGAVTGLVLAAPFGIGRVVEWSLLGTGGYLSLDPSDLGFAAVRLLALAAIAVGFWGGAWLLVAAGGRPAGPVEAADPPERRREVDLWLLLAGSLLGVVAGFRFFPHYLLQALPAVALLAARGYARRPAWHRPALAWGAVAVAAAAVLAWGVVAAPDPSPQTALGRYVEANTRPGDQVLVWGNLPEVYWLGHRQPAGGFTHSEFVTGYSGGRRHTEASEATVPDRQLYDDWIARLEADPPALVLDTAAAEIRGGEQFPIDRFPQLQRFLDRHYRKRTTVEGVPIYERTAGR